MANSALFLSLCEQQDMTDPSINCYVCSRMRQRKPEWKQAGLSRICLLCNNPFCDKHKGKDDGVCEINHVTYCGKQEHKDLHAPVKIFKSLDARREALGEDSQVDT